MQETTHLSNNSKKYNPSMEVDLESFEFKPVTSGLGFHHEDSKPKKTISRTSRPTLKAKPNTAQRERSLDRKPEYLSIDLPGLHEKTEKEINTNKVKKRKIKKLKEARGGLQLTAFFVDLVLVLSLQLAMNFSFLKLTGLTNLEQFLFFTWSEQLAFFSFLFLFYFSLFDLVSSPGKKLFALRLESTVGKKLGIDQTLVRSIVTLFSFLLMMMPAVFDFQGKLSDTRLVEDA